MTGVPTAALQSVWDIVEPRARTFGEKRGLEKRPLAEVCQGTAFAMNFGRGFGTGCRECGHRMRSGAGEEASDGRVCKGTALEMNSGVGLAPAVKVLG